VKLINAILSSIMLVMGTGRWFDERVVTAGEVEAVTGFLLERALVVWLRAFAQRRAVCFVPCAV
jgi:hypothetical protein